MAEKELNIKIDTEYIKLQALLKLANITSSGAESKHIILDGRVSVDNQIACERGRKIRSGMTVTCNHDGLYKINVI